MQARPGTTNLIMASLHQPSQHPVLTNYSQVFLLNKFNTYFKLNNKPIITDPGFCHGMTLYWLKQMAKGEVNHFHKLVEMIIDTPDSKLNLLKHDIERLFRKIDQMQNPQKYAKKYKNKNISYNNVDELLQKSEKQLSLDNIYTIPSLCVILNKHMQVGNIFCVTNGFEIICDGKPTKHTIGIYVASDGIHLFDANYTSGRATCFMTVGEVVAEILKRLGTEFSILIPPLFPLEMKLVRYQPEKKVHVTATNKSMTLFENRDEADSIAITPSNKFGSKTIKIFAQVRDVFHKPKHKTSAPIAENTSLLSSSEVENGYESKRNQL